MKTEGFMRIRIGVGDPQPGDDLINHVLMRMSKKDRKEMDEVCDNVADAVAYLIEGRIDEAMNKYN